MSAAVVIANHAEAGTQGFGVTTVDVAMRTLPPMPKPVIDEVSFAATARGPDAYYAMCEEQPEDAHLCTLDKIPVPDAAPRVLTKADWVNMHSVLHDLYLGFKPKIDPEIVTPKGKITDIWRYAKDLTGDCEEFAILFKRIMVANHGWQEHEILLARVLDEKKEGHAVALMRTDRGYIVADVKRNHFRLIEETNYEPHLVQKPENRYEWADVTGRTVFAQKPDLRGTIGPWSLSVSGKSNIRKIKTPKRGVALRGSQL